LVNERADDLVAAVDDIGHFAGFSIAPQEAGRILVTNKRRSLERHNALWRVLMLHSSASSDGPPALCDPQTIYVIVGEERTMGNLGAMGAHISGEDEIYEAAVIMQQLLALGIHLGPLLFVQLRSRLDE